VINADSALDLGDRLDGLDPKFRSVLSIPLIIGKDAVGVVTLYSSQTNTFREEQRQAIELISSPVAEAFSRAIRADAVRHDDLGTDLTSTPNGRLLDALVAREGGFLGGGTSRTLGVLCVRVVGSPDIMAHASAAVSQATRVADLIFKPTEDSLVVIMPDCDLSAGRLIMDRIVAAVPDTIVPPPAIESPIRLAFACSPFDGESVRDLLRTAQGRLDQAGAFPSEEAAAVSGTRPGTSSEEGGRPWQRS